MELQVFTKMLRIKGNENSIDYLEYAKTMNLGDVSERDAREHYIR